MNPHIEDVTRRFAAAGYHAIAPALFHRAGGGTAPLRRLRPGDAAVRRRERRRRARRRRRRHRAPQRGRLRRLEHRDHRILLRRPGHLPRRGPAAPWVPAWASTAAGSPSPVACRSRRSSTRRLVADAVAGRVRRPGPVDPGGERGSPAHRAGGGAASTPRSSATPTPSHGFHCDARESYHAESAADGWPRALEWFEGHLQP